MLAVLPLVSLAACSARGSPHPSSTSHAAAVASANAGASAEASCYASGGTWVATGNGSCIPNPTQAASSDSSDSGFSNGGATINSCSTILDQIGWKDGPLDMNTMVSLLTVMLLTDGLGDITSGNLNNEDMTVLNAAEQELANYTGNKLSEDGARLAGDIQAYGYPWGVNPVDTSYASAVVGDILTLQKDCPVGEKMGIAAARS